MLHHELEARRYLEVLAKVQEQLAERFSGELSLDDVHHRAGEIVLLRSLEADARLSLS